MAAARAGPTFVDFGRDVYVSSGDFSGAVVGTLGSNHTKQNREVLEVLNSPN
jgi:hypothetical protein